MKVHIDVPSWFPAMTIDLGAAMMALLAVLIVWFFIEAALFLRELLK